MAAEGDTKTKTVETDPDKKTEAKEVKVAVPRKVTYSFTFPTGNVVLRYAFQISEGGAFDGTKKSSPAAGAKLLALAKGRTQTFSIAPGERVRLYLNSDALAGFRSQPVFEVTPDGRDVEVRITEKTGKDAPADPSLSGPTTEKDAKGREFDVYTGELSGALWMQISHRFTADEAAAYIPSGTEDPIRKAVLSAYSVPKENAVIAEWPPDEEGSDPMMTPVDASTGQSSDSSNGMCHRARRVRMVFATGVDKNAKENIADFDFLRDGLSRTHPNALIAVFNAAYWSGVTEMTLTSAWRPLLGSVAHRTGLGLDLGSIRDDSNVVALNRAQFKNHESAESRYQASLKAVTKAEAKVEDAQAALKTATTNREAAEAELIAEEAKAPGPDAAAPVRKAHEKSLKKAKAKVDSTKTAETTAISKRDKEEAALAKKNADAEEARKARDEAKAKLDEEKAHPEDSSLMSSFRARLAEQKDLITQLFDPWQMDLNTRDTVAATDNTYTSANEKLHINHLHITAYEPSLL